MAGTIGESLLASALQEAAEPRFDPTEWRPSELGHPCDRYLVLRRTGAEGRAPDATDLGYFQRGRIVEDWVVSLYRRRWPRKTRRQLPVRIPVSDGLTLTGHVDLWCPTEGLVVEVKSVSHSVLVSSQLPRAEHLLQVRLYLDALSERFRRPDLRGELVYVSLGRALTWRVFPVMPNALQVRQAKARLVMLEAMARAGQIPEPPFWPDQYPCQWRDGDEIRTCPFYEACHGAAAKPTDLEALPTAQDLDTAVAAWLGAKQAEQEAQQAYEVARAFRKGLEEEMLPKLRALGDRVQTPSGFSVEARWHPGRVTWDIPAALACGAVTEEQLAPFRREGKGWWEVVIRNRKEETP